jgi:hypothetical protein
LRGITSHKQQLSPRLYLWHRPQKKDI